MRIHIIIILFLCTLSICAEDLQLGINVDYIGPSSTQFLFADAFKASSAFYPMNNRTSEIDLTVQIEKDINGYPIEIPFYSSGEQYYAYSTLFEHLDGHYPRGRYTLISKGSGRILVSGDCEERVYSSPGRYFIDVVPGNNGLQISLLESNIDDPITKINFMFPGYSESDSEIFYQPFIDKLKNFNVIRTMNFTQVNEYKGDDPLISSGDPNCEMSWDFRTLPTYQTQLGCGQGMAWEHIINSVKAVDDADIWITIPHAANNEYIEELANLLLDTFPTNRKIYIELSNEFWNFSNQFQQSYWFKSKADILGIEYWQFYVKRSTEVMAIFNRVFGHESDNLIKVISSQQGNSQLTELLLTSLLDNSINTSQIEIDALAIGSYFGLLQIEQYDPPSTNVILNIAKNQINDIGISTRDARALLDNYSRQINKDVDLICYEGGQHMTPMNSDWEYIYDNESVAPFISANRDPRIYLLYMDWATQWYSNGGSLLMAYSYVSNPYLGALFGHIEYLDQPIREAYKYRALLDIMLKY